MRFIYTGFLCFFIFSCSGGSDSGSLPPSIPKGSLKGVAHANILVNSTITGYQYSSGSTGDNLGSAVTSDEGNYSLDVQLESGPVMLEATGGYYLEEASGAQINLATGQSLRAVFNFRTGQEIAVAITPFTHLAAGLAEYKVRQGISVSTAIDEANQEVSTLLGLNIISTMPLDITNPLNTSAFVSNEHLYGFFNAAISSLTKHASVTSDPQAAVHSIVNSITFAQLMYEDVKADGVLDGKGFDQNGVLVPLSIGVIPFNQDIYRHALAAHLVQIAKQSQYNKTTLTGDKLSNFASSYASSAANIFSGAAPLSFVNNGMPVISFNAPDAAKTLKGPAMVSASVESNVSIASLLYFVDDSLVHTDDSTTVGSSFAIDSSLYSDGSHTLTAVAIDSYGIRGSASINVLMNNFIPVGKVSGVVKDNVLQGSTITAYDYSSGLTGSAFGSAVTDVNGDYTLSLRRENTPVLLVATGGSYKEEASKNSVSLSGDMKLLAAINYVTGSVISAHITPFTHIAAGLADYKIKHGAAVSTAINEANQEVSSLLGFNILTTRPVDITQASSASAVASNEHIYGFLSGAISGLTRYASEKVGDTELSGRLHLYYNSIRFAQVMYNDINSDGLLNGRGFDNNGNLVQLSFGATPINVNLYRHGIAAHLIQIIHNPEANKTTLTEAKLLDYATGFAASHNPLYGNVSGFNDGFVNSGRTVVSSLYNNVFIGNTKRVCASVSPYESLDSVTLNFNGTDITPGSVFSVSKPCWTVNVSGIADGSHPLVITATDNFGIVSSATTNLIVDNTPPTTEHNSSATYPNFNVWPKLCGTAYDAGSGLVSITETISGDMVYILRSPAASASWCLNARNSGYYGGYAGVWTIRVRDSMNNCTTYSAVVDKLFSQPIGAAPYYTAVTSWTTVSQGTCD